MLWLLEYASELYSETKGVFKKVLLSFGEKVSTRERSPEDPCIERGKQKLTLHGAQSGPHGAL